ncbi:hypothetical protein ACEPPN_006810 [Leptodophora sp. 'Broadleaf-Isolate-01']
MATLLNNLSTSLSTTGKEQVLPALNSLSKAITSFSANQLGPALAGAAIGLDVFGKEKVIPAMLEAGKFGKEKIGPKVLEVGEYVRENAGPAVKKTGEYVKENPGMTAVYAVSGLTILVPGLVSGPALWVFGWGGLGVRGGSAAAAIQASTGNIIAGSGFATLQSAGMGGYGVAAVNGVVQGCSAAVGGIGGLIGLRNRTVT